MIYPLKLMLPHHWVWAWTSPAAKARQRALDQLPREWAPADEDRFGTAALLPFVWGKYILEVGAGSGAVTRHLTKLGLVTALEPSHCFFEGKRNVPEASWHRSRWEVWMKGDYTTIVMAHTLHHIADRQRCARWVATELRKGGRWCLLEPRHTWRRALRLGWYWFRYWCYRPKAEYGQTHDFLTRGEIRSLCKYAGFRLVQEMRGPNSTLWVLERV